MKKRFLGILPMVALCLLTGCKSAPNPNAVSVMGPIISSEKMLTSPEFPGTGIHAEKTSEDVALVLDEVVQKSKEWDITIMATGDNLMHMGIVYTGKQEDGSYNFDFLFEGIADFLAVADIKITNQETILGGNELGFSGYPRFNSPTEVGDAIAAAGFNVVLQASNHSADKGIEGLLSCVEFWKTHPEVLMVGIHEEAGETHDIPLLTIKETTFAILNYTYSPNMSAIPSDVQGHLDILCEWNRNTGYINFTKIDSQVLADIEEADEIADVVIVCPHWGTEYTTTPSSYQKEFAEQMTQAGADLIIGTHPHVVQPVEWVESENGNRALCYYSLGNFVSTQKNGLSMLEGMAWVTFHVTEEGITITEEKTGIIPMVCQYKSGPVRMDTVYLLEDYTEELAAKHGILGYGGVNLKLSDLQEWSDEVLGDWVISADEALATE